MKQNLIAFILIAISVLTLTFDGVGNHGQFMFRPAMVQDWVILGIVATTGLLGLYILLTKTKQNSINLGLKYFLDISQHDKEKIKRDFQKANPNISSQTIDSYFNDYNALYNYSEKYLSELRRQNENKHIIENIFYESVSKSYNWVDKMNLKKLYDVCSFYLR